MAYPVTLNGRTYTLADFEGQNYVDGLPDAFEDFVTHAGNLYSTTSTTSNSIGTGSKTFTVESSKPYQVGTPLRITDSAAPSTNWIDAIVTAYSGTTLTVDAVSYAGSGTKTSWDINIGGGGTSYTGTLPIAQGGTGGTTAAAARTNLDTYSKSEADSRFLNVSGEASDVTINDDLLIQSASDATITLTDTTNTCSTILESRNTTSSVGTSTTHDFQIITDDTQRIRLNSNGDVNFYNDAGSATKMIWKAADERLGIGTDSPSSALEVAHDGTYGLTISSTGNVAGIRMIGDSDDTGSGIQEWEINVDSGPLTFNDNTAGAERFRINQNGKVLIGGTNTTSAQTLDMGVYLQSQANNDVIGYSLYTNEGSNNRRATFFLDDDNGIVGIDMSASSGVPSFIVRRGGSEKIRVDGDGLKFNGDTASANALDDYEEGTWTPTFTNVSAPTYQNQQGRYTKIGRICYFTIDIEYSSLDTADPSALAVTVPFTSNNNGIGGLIQLIPTSANTGFIGGQTEAVHAIIGDNATNFAVQGTNNSSTYDYDSGKFAASGTLHFAGWYETA